MLATIVAAASACPRSSGREDAGLGDAQVTTPQPSPPPTAPESAGAPPPRPPPPPPKKLHCPPAMVSVAERFCIDKWEAQLLDKTTRTPLSPFYPPADRTLAIKLAEAWERD